MSAQCPLLFLGDSPTVVRFAARPVMSLSLGTTPTLGIFLTSLTSGVFCEYVTPSSVSGGLTYGGPVRYAPGHVAFARNDPHSGYFFNSTYEWSFFVNT